MIAEQNKEQERFNDFMIRYEAASSELDAIYRRVQEVEKTDDGRRELMKICAEWGKKIMSIYFDESLNFDKTSLTRIDEFLKG